MPLAGRVAGFSFWRICWEVAKECGLAEFADSLVVRPFLMLVLPKFFGFKSGMIVASLTADVLFYVTMWLVSWLTRKWQTRKNASVVRDTCILHKTKTKQAKSRTALLNRFSSKGYLKARGLS